MGWYEFTDIFTTSPNERKRDKYSKLISKIEKDIADLNEYIRLSKSGIEGFFNVYASTDTLYGEAIEKFQDYGRNLEKSVLYEIECLEASRNSLNRALDRAWELYNYYNRECIREDEQGAKG